ncbi:MAG: sulfite exporter TauE/SafE family protein [Bacteroidota bacterium]
MLDLTAAALAGLLGSAHCVGMCGGFVALLGAEGGRNAAGRQGAYFLGKTLTYATFGAVAGAAGGSLVALFGTLGGVVGIALGVGMVVAGLALCGVAWRAGRAPGARLAARLGPAITRLVQSGSPAALVGLGAVNGLLPCGLVYGMLAVAAASGSAAGGAATMAVFGLATVPALALTGHLGARWRPASRLRMQRLAGVLVIVMGALTLTRGAMAFAPAERPEAVITMCGPELPEASVDAP